jgi:hypothetical protein
MKKNIVQNIIALFLLAFFVGCGKSISLEEVAGQYAHKAEIYTLNSDGTGEMNFGVGKPESIKWRIDGEHVIFDTSLGENIKFLFKEGSLYLEANSTTFKKIKGGKSTPTFDATSEESQEKSGEIMMQGMTKEEEKEFTGAVMTVALLINQIDISTLLDDAVIGKKADAETKKKQEERTNNALHGKTALEIVAYANELIELDKKQNKSIGGEKALDPEKQKHDAINACINNLKHIGIGFRIYATDNQDRFPWHVPSAEGGCAESMSNLKADPDGFNFKSGGPALVLWPEVCITLSNELSSPLVLRCPSDKTFIPLKPKGDWPSLQKNNISYKFGLAADEAKPKNILALCKHHASHGVWHVLLSDSSVVSTDSAGLKELWIDQHQKNLAELKFEVDLNGKIIGTSKISQEVLDSRDRADSAAALERIDDRLKSTEQKKIQQTINVLDTRGFSHLHYAAGQPDSKKVTDLIDQGADVNILTQKESISPLHMAACNTVAGNAKILINNGAKINAITTDKFTYEKPDGTLEDVILKGETPLDIFLRTATLISDPSVREAQIKFYRNAGAKTREELITLKSTDKTVEEN